MIIDEPAVLSSGYSSKDAAECSSPENRHVLNERRIPMASSATTATTKSVDIHRRRHRIPPAASSSSTTLPGKRVSHSGSLTIDESSPEPHDIHRTRVIGRDKPCRRRLSPICDEHVQHFPLQIPSDDPRASPASSSSSRQATLFARRHFHIYDWTRFSFYDNVPSPFDHVAERCHVDDRSPTSTSSTDRQDSGLGTSSVERQIDPFVLSNHVHRSLSSISSSSSNATNTLSTCSRLPSVRKVRVKWHSFTKTHRPSFNSAKYHLGQMSVGQLFALRRAAAIRIQELFDTKKIFSAHKEEQKPTLVNRTVAARQCLIATAFSAVPKLIIRRHQQRKEIHHEIKRSVFGVSLLSMTQRTGHPIPITIISAMKYLRRTAMDSVGIFRKPGVSHRIKRLHESIESNFEFHQFDDFSPYDVSDVLKQYFRFLPECLFTRKLSSVFLNVNEHFPSTLTMNTVTVKLNHERRLLAVQYAILLLPDENRLVLHLLLSFLNDVAKHSQSNQMSSMNLATCFAPTLFSFETYTKLSSSVHGMPDQKEIQEQRKAMEILAFMIDHVRLLFLVPNELHQACHFSYIEIGEPCTLEELSRRVCETSKASPMLSRSRPCASRKRSDQQQCVYQVRAMSASDSSDSLLSSSCEHLLLNVNNNNNNNHLRTIASNGKAMTPWKSSTSYQNFIDRCIVEIVRESCHTKLKGWMSLGKTNSSELAFKKLDDGHPLSLWKCSIEIEAPPVEILNRLLNERQLWDDDFQSGSIVEQLNRNTHVYQYTINSMAPLASRYFCEVRSWRSNIYLNTSSSCLSSGSSKHLSMDASLCGSSGGISSLMTTSMNPRREACVLVCTSIEHPKANCPPSLVRAVTLASRYLIQAHGCGKSRVTHLSRVDLMGRSNEWYTKAYGSILTRSMVKLRDSFVQINTGPETKV